MIITKTTKTTVFFVPMTSRITNIFGNDKEGPASNSAKAGPFPIPDASNPWIIGTSVRVAKYMKAPTTLAQKLDHTVLPPTAHSIHEFGTTPGIEVSPWVEPKRNPAVTTPTASKGIICFAKPHAESVHSRLSSSCLSKRVITLKEIMPTTIGTKGTNTLLFIKLAAKSAEATVAKTPAATHCHLIFKIFTNE
ncbi:hypothetical protein SDC9_173402 [bioreactor metagenome]|uniref:Uncharacterized protein n=1 Tax=bioreactor metagenome TaxID=1076179 RepID=A0A645GIL8_9ZZZZ